jgi:quinol monooxygenase YgiN
VLALTRYRVPDSDAARFAVQARAALDALTARPGCLGARLGRAVDDASLWVLATLWESVGAYRRALGDPEVKLLAVPLMYRALDEPGAFEDLRSWAPGQPARDHESALAPDAAETWPGRHLPPGYPGARPG